METKKWSDPTYWEHVSIGNCSQCDAGHVLRDGICWNCRSLYNCILWLYRIGFRINEANAPMESLIPINSAWIKLAHDSGLPAERFLALDQLIRAEFPTTAGSTRLAISNVMGA